MIYTVPAIGSYSNTLLVDPVQSSDFTVKVRFYCRSYDGTVTMNGSNNINAISGTAPLMSGDNGNQHFAHVVIEEVR
ncbi:MAG: hypothetical protein WA194_04280 [Patescibacteria group bacterium]